MTIHITALCVEGEARGGGREVCIRVCVCTILDSWITAEIAVFHLELVAGCGARGGTKVIYERSSIGEFVDLDCEAVNLVGVAWCDVPGKGNCGVADARNRLELHNLHWAEAGLEIGEYACAAACRRYSIEILPACGIAPAVVRIYPVNLARRTSVIYGIAVDDHLMYRRVDLYRRTVCEIVCDGCPKVVVAVSPAAHYGTRLVPRSLRT